jgi:predicted transposase YbfD/YdcC
LLNLKGCIVTTNTQKETVDEIREQGADYLLAVKENHPYLPAEIKGVFDAALNETAIQK